MFNGAKTKNDQDTLKHKLNTYFFSSKVCTKFHVSSTSIVRNVKIRGLTFLFKIKVPSQSIRVGMEESDMAKAGV